ncbi:MAG TPA: tetratricopeptide repeat protein [Planctomycetota bacterium]|nr:tetratricopeptide repeat protein [Planctomycetota bacterium]
MFVLPVLGAALLGALGAADAIARAAQAMEDGDARSAYDVLRPLAESTRFGDLEARDRPRAWCLLGLAAEAVQDPETAAAAHEKALEENGAELLEAQGLRDACLLSLARSALDVKDADLARRTLERAGAEARSSREGLRVVALAAFFAGDLPSAKEVLEKWRSSSNDSEASYYLGVLHFDRGDRAKALELFDEALRRDPSSYYAKIYSARAALELDRAADALRSVDALLAATPTAESHYLRGKCLLRLARWEEAAGSFRRSLELKPRYAEALYSLGDALRRLGRADASRAALMEFEKVHREEQERLRKADRLSQKLLRSPGDAATAEELARLDLEGDDLDGAEKNAWRAVRSSPSSEGGRLLLARILVRAGRYSAAALQYQRLLAAHPTHAEARSELEDLIRKHARGRK